MWDTWPDEHFGLSIGQRILPVHGDQSTRWLGMCYSNSGTNREIPYFMDLETGEIKEVTQNERACPMTEESPFWPKPTMAAGLSRLRRRAAKLSGMALITPEQLLAGSTDWQEITMWQG